MIMSTPDIQKLFPISRLGNEKSPKLIILLCNPGGNIRYYKRLPEYVMDKDGFYKSSDMNLHIFREYSAWWDKLLKKTDGYIKDTDILTLEYYPYHTKRSSDYKHWDWDMLAKKSLTRNKELLLKHIQNGVPVFGYYHSLWLNDDDVKQQLLSLEKANLFYKTKNSLGQSVKLKELENWLSKLNKSHVKKS